MLQQSLSMLKSNPSDHILGVSEILNFSFFVYLKFMPSPQLFDLIRESSDRFAFLLFTFPSAFESKLSTLQEMQKASHPPQRRLAFLCSGDTTRTCGLRVMSPTSYQLLHPAIYLLLLLFYFNLEL